MPKIEPQRSCLGCRQVKGKFDLLRFVLDGERKLVPDLQSKLPGRGAYTCLSRACIASAVKKNQFSRAFHGPVETGSPDEVLELLSELLAERVASYLALANKAGKIVSGTDLVLDKLKGNAKPGVVIIAGDISADIGSKIVSVAERTGVAYYYLFDRDRLGALLGKGLRSVVAVGAGGFVMPLVTAIEKYRNFFDGGAVNEQNPRL